MANNEKNEKRTLKKNKNTNNDINTTTKSKSTKPTNSTKPTPSKTNNPSITPASDTKKNNLLSYSFKINEFGVRGLNKYRNILTAPDCECGCGGKLQPTFKAKNELHDFCGSILYDMDCMNAAIFLEYKNGKQEIVYGYMDWDEKTEKEKFVLDILSEKKKTSDFFAEFDAQAGLHCYGLMIERDNKSWEICE